MNKYQKVVNQIAKSDSNLFNDSFNARRMELRQGMRINKLTFISLLEFKRFNKDQNIILKSFMDSILN